MNSSPENPIDLMELPVGATVILPTGDYQILAVSDYDYGVDGKSTEYDVTDSIGRPHFLEIEWDEGEFLLYLSQEIEVPDAAIQKALSGKRIAYQGGEYTLDATYRGQMRNADTNNQWVAVQCHSFYSGSKFLNIELLRGDVNRVYAGNDLTTDDIIEIRS